MYQVRINGTLIHDLRVDGLKLFEPKLSHEINKAGSFIFTVYPSHPYISMIGKKLKPIITIEDESGTIWRGRVLNTEDGFYNQEQCTCEGELAFFNDSIVRTYDYSGGLAGYFELLINQHNDQVDEEKQFKVGNVTVTDPNDYVHFSSNQFPKTLSEIKEKLIDKYGGYLWFRHESDGVYIDYLEDSDLLCNQPVELGKNLIDLTKVVKGQDVATVIIPRGAIIDEETGERVSIESVNDGKDYVVNEEAAELFGKIQRVVEFDDVTQPENLLSKAQEYAADYGNLIASMTFTAADLHKAGSSINNFRLFRYVSVHSDVHEIDEKYLIKKIDIDLNDPTYGKLSSGKTVKTLIDKQLDNNGKYGQIVERVEKVESNAKINEGAVAEVMDTANEANTKSDKANQKVDGLVYDNRNYILKSGNYVEDGESGWEHRNDDMKNYYSLSVCDGYTRLSYIKSVSNSTYRFKINLSGPIASGEKYTLSMMVRRNSPFALVIALTGGTYKLLKRFTANSFTADTWTELIYTFQVDTTYTLSEISIDCDTKNSNYASLQNEGDYIDIEWIKMEKGEKATPWSPAPEDDVNNLRDDTNAAIIALKEEVGSQIDQSAESVKTTVYENVYVKDEVDSLVSSVSTEVEQTKDSWQITFNQFQADVDDIANGNDAKFEEIKKYIRFEDGNILLGNSESPLVLKIQNDRIQFLQNGYEVAYISDRKMYNTICSVIDRLEIGDSAWQVEHNEDGDTVVSLVPIY